MKILYLSAEPLRPGQASATHIRGIIQGLERAGHHVTACIAERHGDYESTSLLLRLRGYWGLWRRAMTHLRDSDVVYARAHFANFPVAMLARLRGTPVVHEVNGGFDDLFITHRWLKAIAPLFVLLQRTQYRAAQGLAAVTPGLNAWVSGQAPKVPVWTIPNGVDPAVFKPRPEGALPMRERPYALFFGGFTRWHGIETILAAAAHPAWPAGLDALLIGNGQLAGAVRKAQAENPLVCWLDAMPQAELADYAAGATVGLVPINSVGGRGDKGLFPLKLFELLAAAVPVVVTDYPGQAELVKDLAAGVIVPPDDAEALARAVAQLHASPIPADHMAGVARFVADHYSWDVQAARIAGILVSLLATRIKPDISRSGS